MIFTQIDIALRLRMTLFPLRSLCCELFHYGERQGIRQAPCDKNPCFALLPMWQIPTMSINSFITIEKHSSTLTQREEICNPSVKRASMTGVVILWSDVLFSLMHRQGKEVACLIGARETAEDGRGLKIPSPYSSTILHGICLLPC